MADIEDRLPPCDYSSFPFVITKAERGDNQRSQVGQMSSLNRRDLKAEVYVAKPARVSEKQSEV